MNARLVEKLPSQRFRGDKIVTFKIVANTDINIKFNQRQVWFLEQLQLGRKLQTKDIVLTWGVHKRTAKRDTALLAIVGLITFVPVGRSGWYKIL